MNRNKILIIVFFFILIVKLSFSIIFLASETSTDFRLSRLSNIGGDTHTYISPMKNYIEKGSYYAEKNNIKFYSLRPPHYMFLYLFFSKIGLSENHIFDMISLFQHILNSFSILLLSILFFNLFKSKIAFLISVIFLTLSSSLSHFNHIILPESTAISCVGISIFILYKYYKTNKLLFLFLTSIFMAYSIQMRPYLFLSFIIPPIYIYSVNKHNLKSGFTHLALYIIGFNLVITPWVIRNYIKYNTFVPYEYKLLDYYYDFNYNISSTKTKRDLLNVFGESDVFWEVKSMSSFFEDSSSIFKKNSEFKFKKRYFTKNIEINNFEKARLLYLNSNDNKIDAKDSIANKYIYSIINTYKKEKWYIYYIVSPMKKMKDMIFHKGTYYFPFTYEQSNLVNKSWKVLEFFMYQILLVFSFIGFIILLKKRNIFLSFCIVPLSIIITTSILKHAEYRYFALAYPALFFFAIYAINTIIKKLRARTPIQITGEK